MHVLCMCILVINELFGAAPFDFAARWSHPSLLLNLLIFTVCKFAFTCIAVGAPLSCGVYTPVFLIGAASGRGFGEVINLLSSSERQITAGGYAVVGAAAMAAGVTRTISTAVIVFELTGQLSHMLPVLVAVLLATGVGNLLSDSIYDTMMRLNQLPFLQPLELHQSHGLTARDVMDPLMDPRVLALSMDCSYGDVDRLLRRSDATEFPVVESGASLLLVGAVRRSGLEQLVQQMLARQKERQKEGQRGRQREGRGPVGRRPKAGVFAQLRSSGRWGQYIVHHKVHHIVHHLVHCIVHYMVHYIVHYITSCITWCITVSDDWVVAETAGWTREGYTSAARASTRTAEWMRRSRFGPATRATSH